MRLQNMQHIQLNIGNYENLSLFVNDQYIGMFFRAALNERTLFDHDLQNPIITTLFIQDQNEQNVFGASVDGRKYTIKRGNEYLRDHELRITEA